MKHMTCAELGGACEALITGNTPEEIADNAQKHGMEMLALGDEAHITAMESMKNMTPEEMQSFMTDFKKRFEEADEM